MLRPVQIVCSAEGLRQIALICHQWIALINDMEVAVKHPETIWIIHLFSSFMHVGNRCETVELNPVQGLYLKAISIEYIEKLQQFLTFLQVYQWVGTKARKIGNMEKIL